MVEATLDAVKTLFAQHVAGFKGANVSERGRDVAAVWTVGELQDLPDEWLIVGWAHRPHEALRDPHAPRRVLTPNERYAGLVAVAGYLPITLSGTDYLELLPVTWRAINDYGISLDLRTYDCPELGPWRRQRSGLAGKRGQWEVHYDPYDLSQVFVRTPDGWVTAPWTHRGLVAAPFADFTWRHARRLVAESGRQVTEAEIARALDALLTRAEHGPDTAGQRVVARTRAAAAATARPPAEPHDTGVDPAAAVVVAAEATSPRTGARVIPFGVFDADAEAERWP